MKDEATSLIIIGASGHGKVIADIATGCGYENIAFLDDNETLKSCMRYPIIGKSDTAKQYKDADFIIAIGNSEIREKIQADLLKKDLKVVTLIHPNAVIAENVVIGIGTVIMAGAVVDPDTKIGNGCIINMGATVGHDDVIEDYVHISAGSHVAGTVHIGKGSWIGIGAVVSNNINICDGCMIGAGTVVVKDIDESGTYVGVPARKII
jgi:sugar O-acyltransferase (sialic acid O-acetyltransferase NeuD family)